LCKGVGKKAQQNNGSDDATFFSHDDKGLIIKINTYRQWLAAAFICCMNTGNGTAHFTQ
jgi:hypothetical protein